jgi:beta-carotene 3-hydroxylase
MSLILNISIIIVTFWLMEFIAWATHKYVMHGFLWKLHKDHHQVNKDRILENNDAFFLIFAIPGAVFMIIGSTLLYVGIGITLYGFAYFIVHEVFIHQRIKLFKRTRITYFKAIRKAHKVHHKSLVKENGSCFGMLIVPFKYWKEAKV